MNKLCGTFFDPKQIDSMKSSLFQRNGEFSDPAVRRFGIQS